MIILVLTTILIAGCGGGSSSTTLTPSPTPETLTIVGDFKLSGFGGRVYDYGDCKKSAYGGYSDIGPGASVTVKDEAGAIIAIGKLEDGTAVESFSGFGETHFACLYEFSIPDVAISDFYSIEVTHRGDVNFTRGDVESGTVHLTLGD